MVKAKTKKRRSDFFLEPFLKVGDIVDGEVIEHRPRALLLDLGKATGIVFGREYLEARRSLRKLKPGDKIKAKVISLDGEEGYIELSVKEALMDSQKDSLQNLYQKKEVVEAKVVGANRGGLLLTYNGFDGFLPTSQMSKEHFPKGKTDQEILDRLKAFVGEKLKVAIFNYSPRQKKIIFTENI